MENQFPIRPTYFRGPPLSDENQRQHVAMARETAHSLVQMAYNEQWRFVPPEKDGVQYRKDTSNMECSYRYIRSAVILKCTAAEITTMFKHQATDGMRNFMKKFMAKAFVDGMVLHNVTPSTVDNNASDDASVPITDEVVTVKWGVLDVGMTMRRDVCVVDLIGDTFVPNTPEKSALHMWCMTSIDGNNVGCLSLKDSHGITRTEITKLGFFWQQISRDELEVVVCGSFKSKHVKPIAASIVGAMQRLGDMLEDLRLSYQNFAHRSTWVKDSDRSGCILCMRTFHTLRRKHHCRMCGDLICSDCSIVKVVALPVIGSSKLRLCKVCCIRAKSTPVVPNPVPSLAPTPISDKDAMDSARSRGFTNQTSFDSGSSPLSASRLSDSEVCDDDGIDHCSTKNLCGEVMRVSLGRLSTVQQNEEKRDSAINWQKKMDAFKPTGASKENMFGLLCDLACETLNCPIAVVCLLDGQKEKVKSMVGLENCALQSEVTTFVEKIMGLSPIVILDAGVDKLTVDIFERVPILRFFAGCPIFGRNSKHIGYICVADTRKRTSLGSSCAFTMERLATLAATTMEAHMAPPDMCPAPSMGGGDSTEIRMRDLLLKSYMTQQQIATQSILH
ncbi:Aste57867_9669 [Aphanomyces stellatus]|uniref:Aste57867_9669 protein n=1 Tax=Aphanomyces stellatus TaxID=120398 RepID=A0A485KNK0_9STRA|nr:hypothetical protein As57867_009631 [Aphanomyces stellatus]VFT86548.1 Aste57867_9669 [Aphanomyces stellatus]